jgi:hypothetical protein
MHTNVRRAIGVLAAVSAIGISTPAWSDDGHGRDHREDHRERFEQRRAYEVHMRHAAERREWERRREFDRQRAAAHWRFERGHGWRFEHRPGFWSPYFVWWVVDGRPVMRPYPTARIVRYQTGYYELVGDGFNVPYYWVWRPTVYATVPPPVPLPPPPPADYPFPPDGAYPPPPVPPSG